MPVILARVLRPAVRDSRHESIEERLGICWLMCGHDCARIRGATGCRHQAGRGCACRRAKGCRSGAGQGAASTRACEPRGAGGAGSARRPEPRCAESRCAERCGGSGEPGAGCRLCGTWLAGRRWRHDRAGSCIRASGHRCDAGRDITRASPAGASARRLEPHKPRVRRSGCAGRAGQWPAAGRPWSCVRAANAHARLARRRAPAHLG